MFAAAACGVALAAAGCGGGEDEELTRTEFIAEADAICTAADTQLADQFQQEFPRPPRPPMAVEFARDFSVANLQDQHDQIAALPVPVGEEAAVEELLDDLQDGIDSIEKDPRVVLQPGGGKALAEAMATARDFGLEVCGT